jgi:F-type H+-transporting ATPase subunit b
MNLIEFSITFFFTLLNIAVLCIVLRAILFKPVTKFIEARQTKIKQDIDTAARDREEAKNLRANYEAKLHAADAEARAIVQKAQCAAEERVEALVAEGKADADALVEAARKQIAAEQQAAFLVFKAEAAALVMQAASRLVQRELSGEDTRRLAEAAIAEYTVARMGQP